jgi:trehalose-6-phosphate synthase
MTRTKVRRVRDSLLVVVCALVSSGIIFGLLYDVIDGALRRWTERDLSRRAHLIELAATSHLASSAALQQILNSLAMSDEVAGLVVCAPGQNVIAATGIRFDCRSPLARQATRSRTPTRVRLGDRNVAVSAHSIGVARLFVLQDRDFLDRRRKHVLRMLFVGAELAVLALLILARAGTRIGSRRFEEAARAVVRRMRSEEGSTPVPRELRLLVRDVHDTVEQLRIKRPATNEGAARLRAFANSAIANGKLILVANREPYAHEWESRGSARIDRPASGLVNGVEPVLRACGGTWIAHAGGSADRAFSDPAGRLAVPPDDPDYILRRLWIGEEQYQRYYSGLANEGLWPLCHLAHTQPTFRPLDWLAYQNVNATFARAALEEATRDSLVLIQDYHFALMPRMVRNLAGHLVTSLFWHIPWPNSEIIGIFPWKEKLLEGITGADIVGFHTRQYCLNFLDSVQRYLECRVDFDAMSVTYGGRSTLVRPYPISVEWPYPAASREEGRTLRRSLGISDDAHVSIGVDRADYTKGLIERVAAIEHLLEQNRSLIGKYVFVQFASPTRSAISKYQEVAHDLGAAVDRVNARFQTATWKPILLQMRTLSADAVRAAYAMAESALVTPLHDGMNLVAKEYVASCDDANGVLVLSAFAGAAKELDGALLVNPYDIEQFANVILRAIRMPLAERRSRMHAMRDQIAANSIYDWSRKILSDMCDVRQHAGRFWPRETTGRIAAPRKAAG